MNKSLRVLQVEDSEVDAELILYMLRREGYNAQAERVENAAGMRRALVERTWDVIVADYHLPCFSALEAIEVLRETGKDIPFIVVSGAVGEDVAVETMRLGAHDYLLKSSLTRLAAAVERETVSARMRRQLNERGISSGGDEEGDQERRDHLAPVVARRAGPSFFLISGRWHHLGALAPRASLPPPP